MHGPPRRLFPDCARAAVSDGSDEPGPLMPEEAEAVQGAVPSRQREFALGRWCARQALAELGVAPRPIRVGHGRAPCWPRGIVGSITHCRGFVGAVVAPADRLLAIGFDAEVAVPLESELIPLICTATEIAWVRSVRPAPLLGWPKVIFSAKEAIYKCVSPLFGQTPDFLDVTLALDPERWVFSATAVDFGQVRGRMAVTEQFVFACAYVASRSPDADEPDRPAAI